MSPADADGNWFLAVTDLHCWCTSNWQSIRYAVLRPGERASKPAVLLSDSREVYLGAAETSSLEVGPNDITLRFAGAQALDPGLLVRSHVLHCIVEGTVVTRIAPYALAPEDFVDEWIELPWTKASLLTDAAAVDDAERWHSLLQTPAYRPEEVLLVQHCPDGSTEVGVRTSRCDVYLRVGVDEAGEFRISAVGTERSEACPGDASPYDAIETE